jgi:gamma-glutamylaminecyclotransferase
MNSSDTVQAVQRLFVYGSLKEGFPNFHVNKGRRVAGTYRTAAPCALYLVSGQLPCLMPAVPGGLQVLGQLFEVNADELAAMDALERVGQPGGYARSLIALERVDVAPTQSLQAFVYTQHESQLQRPGQHLGPLAEYTQEHAKRLHW